MFTVLKLHGLCLAFLFIQQPKQTIMNTEIFSQVNWLAVLVATLAYFMLGALWYSKILFGAKWASLVKLDMNNPDLKKGMGKMMAGSFVLMLIVCTGLALLIVKFDFIGLGAGIRMGMLTGLCFATTAVSITYIYENKPSGLYLITNGYHVLGHVIAAIIIVLWR
jgi:hypothetical protein